MNHISEQIARARIQKQTSAFETYEVNRFPARCHGAISNREVQVQIQVWSEARVNESFIQMKRSKMSYPEPSNPESRSACDGPGDSSTI
jgi:hypothetical protein